MIQETGRSFYHFDRIRINSQKDIKIVKNILPIKELEQECYSFKIRKPYEKASALGNESCLEIIVASQKALEILRKHHTKLRPYQITYLEITKDTFKESEEQAVSEVKRKKGTLRKRWSRGHFVNDPDKKENYYPKAGYYNTPVIYCGGKSVKYVLYARPSKLNEEPCAHEEWRLTSPYTIKRVTEISTIKGLVLFDIKTFIEKRNEKFLRDDKLIDMMKLGKWLKDCTRRRKFTDKERSDIKFRATSFCTAWDIRSFGELINHFNTYKFKIKKNVGRRDAFEKKILEISNYNRFARTIDS
jgi:hypothetical protein